jgi:hypothetical protein
MARTIWVSILAAALVAAGGWYYYVHYQASLIETTDARPTPEPTQAISVDPKQSDAELNRKRQEGIGSIKDLKPVPLEAGAAKGSGG